MKCNIVYLYNKYTILHFSNGRSDDVDIIISNNSSKPIYEQIISQIKAMIMSGELQSGEMLPSMRALAKSLHISVITGQKAYEELQRDGFIETVTGKGTFVAAQNKDFIQEEHLRQIEQKLMDAADLGRSSAVSLEKMIELLTIFYQDDE